MGQTLRKRIFIKVLLFIAFLWGGASLRAYSQSLQPGNVAFTGLNVDGNEDFAIVTFADLGEGDKIHFRNEEWNGSEFTGPGGHLTWVVPSGGITAGTVIVFNEVTGEPTASVGSITGDADFYLSSTGDVLYAYTGSSQDTPDTFLGAIATSADKYNQPDGSEGTLANTGLSEGSTAILLADNIDIAEYSGDRSGNTQQGYLDLLNNVGSEEAANDNWDQFNSSDSPSFPPFDTERFALVSAPTVAFTTNTLSKGEGGTVDITIELVQANSTAVDMDLAFLGGASTASASDIGNYSTQNVSFGADAASGATKTVTIDLANDNNFEGTERAVFDLQHISTGTIIKPGVTTLRINDNDAPNIVINEINADPAGDITGDADGNGTQDERDDEFIEFVNNQNSDIDISNWQVFNETDLKHTFPQGTVVPANGALVLFGDDDVSPQGNFGGAIVQGSNESASLGLENGGDTITLKDQDDNEITSVSYPDASDNQSLTRSPDITGSFENHSQADSDGDKSLFSPGTRIDGTPFGADHAIALRGTEGWRLIASPVADATFDDFFGKLWMQGVPNSDDPSGPGTLYEWNESGGGAFSAPGNMTDQMIPGKGYIVYVFEDDEYNTPGIQGGFPKIIRTDKNENTGTVRVPVSSHDADGSGSIDGNEGFNLLGNPFDTDISASAVIDALEAVSSNVNTNISVWDHQTASWKLLDGSDGSDDTIAPFQAFFVKFTSDGVSGDVEFTKSKLEANTGTQFYKNNVNVDNAITFDLQLHGEKYMDMFSMEFGDRGTADLDRYDGYKFYSLNPNSINLYSTINGNRLQKNVLPRQLESALEIPLSFNTSGRKELTFKWDNKLDKFPSEWELVLVDKQQNREIDLRRSNEYHFTLNNSQDNTGKSALSRRTLLNKTTADNSEPRFALKITPAGQTADNGEDIPESIKLNPNYPNPFNPSTTIPYELTEDANVKLTVWNMIGQKVATLVDGPVEAGSHKETWNASDMPSGIYIARFEVEGKVFTRKMTLIK